MVKINYTYQPVPKAKITCSCGAVFYARKDAKHCKDCKRKLVADYFQRWYKANKKRISLARKRPKITKPCVVCGKSITGTAKKLKCEACKRAWRKAYCKKYYLDNKNKKMLKCTQRCKDE